MDLYNSTNHQTYQVTSIPDASLLNSLGVFTGAKILKKDTYKMGGPVLISINSRDVAIGKDLAIQIQVEKCEVI